MRTLTDRPGRQRALRRDGPDPNRVHWGEVEQGSLGQPRGRPGQTGPSRAGRWRGGL